MYREAQAQQVLGTLEGLWDAVGMEPGHADREAFTRLLSGPSRLHAAVRGKVGVCAPVWAAGAKRVVALPVRQLVQAHSKPRLSRRGRPWTRIAAACKEFFLPQTFHVPLTAVSGHRLTRKFCTCILQLAEGSAASSLEAIGGLCHSFACSVWRRWVWLRNCMAELMLQQSIGSCWKPAEALPQAG